MGGLQVLPTPQDPVVGPVLPHLPDPRREEKEVYFAEDVTPPYSQGRYQGVWDAGRVEVVLISHLEGPSPRPLDLSRCG